jgi:hypothetical protein
MEVPLKRDAADGQACAIHDAVELSHHEEAPVKVVDEPVDAVRGAMGAGMVEGLEESFALGAELQDRLQQQRLAREMSDGPSPQMLDPLGHLRPARCLVDVPCLGQHIGACWVAAASIGDLQHRVQEAQDDGDALEQGPERLLCTLPSVRADALRRIRRRQLPRFLGKLAVGGLQGRRVGRLRDSGTEDASPGGHSGNEDLLADEPGVLLVGNQVLGQVLRRLDRGADERGAAQRQLSPIPEHRRAPEHVRERVERDAPVAQIQPVLDLLGQGHHVRHDEGRADRELLLVSVQLDTTDPHLCPLGEAPVIEAEPLAEVRREQLGMLAMQLLQPRPEQPPVVHAPEVVLFALERKADSLVSTGCFHRSLRARVAVFATPSMAQNGESSHCFHSTFLNPKIR